MYLTDMKLRHGDELRLWCMVDVNRPWSGIGYVIKIPDIHSEEVALDMKTN